MKIKIWLTYHNSFEKVCVKLTEPLKQRRFDNHIFIFTPTLPGKVVTPEIYGLLRVPNSITTRSAEPFRIISVIDFGKVFDLVDTQKLLGKLFHYGFSNSALQLIANYFSDRYQSVKYDKKMSPLLKILLGVPQSNVLGPLFFLIMIIDLAFIIDLLCKIFADDTSLGDKDLNTLINRFIEKLKVLLEIN